MNASSSRASEADGDQALLQILDALREAGYRFVTPNKSTHALVRARRSAGIDDILRDVFGWVRTFDAGALPQPLFSLLQRGDLVEPYDDGWRSRIRVSTVDGMLFAHSAPTRDDDAVFLGPDSYRYARFLAHALSHRGAEPVGKALDVGTGSGVGALVLARLGVATTIQGSDINPRALRLARLNAATAGVAIETRLAAGIPAGETFDLIASNPPFIAGDHGKTYRDGGDQYGTALALAWVSQGMTQLRPGGRFLLYTGAPVVAGEDLVKAALRAIAHDAGAALVYEEIDPDIFGASLRQDAYRDVERIAAVGAVLTLP